MLLWLRALWFWGVVERRHLWLTVLVVAVAIAFVLRKGITETEIRITGLVLQVLGIGTVAWGIHETRALFGHPGILTVAREWLRRFPVYGGRVVSGNASIISGGGTVHGRGYASDNAGPDATIEARVEALEKNVKRVNERINQTQSEMDGKFRSQAEALGQEQQTRSKEDHKILAKLEATETGGLHISAMGALWLLVGVTFSTVAPELAKCLN